jgi:hypothetical protein
LQVARPQLEFSERIRTQTLDRFDGLVGSCSGRDWIAASKIRRSRTGNDRY